MLYADAAEAFAAVVLIRHAAFRLRVICHAPVTPMLPPLLIITDVSISRAADTPHYLLR